MRCPPAGWSDISCHGRERPAVLRPPVPGRTGCARYSTRADSRGASRIRRRLGAAPGCELWVETNDKTVGGLIDSAYLDGSDVVLQDYKTGVVLEARQGGGEDVKEAYKVQLRMYAALYHEKTGVRPDRLEVISPAGGVFGITFSQGECVALIGEARDTLMAVAQTVSIATSADAAQSPCRALTGSLRMVSSSAILPAVFADGPGRLHARVAVRCLGNRHEYRGVRRPARDHRRVRGQERSFVSARWTMAETGIRLSRSFQAGPSSPGSTSCGRATRKPQDRQSHGLLAG